MIDGETLARLLEPADCTVSIYMPIQPGDRDLRAPEARLRGLIDEAQSRLDRCAAAPEHRAALLEAVRGLTGQIDFAAHRDPGLAMFARPGHAAEIIPLPIAPPELAVVGPDLHVKPLLPLVAANRRFYILALSRANVRLLAASPFAWTEVKLALPIEAQAELDSRPAAAPEQLEAARIALLVAEPRRVGVAVKTALGDDAAPLVLAADPSVAGHFLQQVHLLQMHATALHLNPFGISEKELHAKAVELLQPELQAELETVLNQINARLGTAEPTVAIRLEEILQAARDGRVDAVVVAEDDALWGRFGEGTLVAHGTPGADDEDLLNLAAVMALRTGGRAFAVPRARLPRNVPAAATLRF